MASTTKERWEDLREVEADFQALRRVEKLCEEQKAQAIQRRADPLLREDLWEEVVGEYDDVLHRLSGLLAWAECRR
jgi:hypothetical protein